MLLTTVKNICCFIITVERFVTFETNSHGKITKDQEIIYKMNVTKVTPQCSMWHFHPVIKGMLLWDDLKDVYS